MKTLRRWFDRLSYKTILRSCADLVDPDPAERILCWPEERAAWIEENLYVDKFFAEYILAVLEKRADRTSYTVRDTENGTLITGPVSSILLQGEKDLTAFVDNIKQNKMNRCYDG